MIIYDTRKKKRTYAISLSLSLYVSFFIWASIMNVNSFVKEVTKFKNTYHYPLVAACWGPGGRRWLLNGRGPISSRWSLLTPDSSDAKQVASSGGYCRAGGIRVWRGVLRGRGPLLSSREPPSPGATLGEQRAPVSHGVGMCRPGSGPGRVCNGGFGGGPTGGDLSDMEMDYSSGSDEVGPSIPGSPPPPILPWISRHHPALVSSSSRRRCRLPRSRLRAAWCRLARGRCWATAQSCWAPRPPTAAKHTGCRS